MAGVFVIQIELHRKRLTARAVSLGFCRTEAEGLVHRTMIMATKLTFLDGKALRLWANRTLRELALADIRQSDADAKRDFASSQSITDASAHHHDQASLLQSSLATAVDLPAHVRRLIQRIVDGEPYETIAQAEHIRLGVLHGAIPRAYALLRSRSTDNPSLDHT